MKTKNRFLHSVLNHAIIFGFVLQIDPELTDLKWEGLSWSRVTSELQRTHECQGLVCKILSGNDQVLWCFTRESHRLYAAWGILRITLCHIPELNQCLKLDVLSLCQRLVCLLYHWVVTVTMIIGAWTLYCGSSHTWCTKIVRKYTIILESSTWIYLTGVKYISRPVNDCF